MFKIRMKYLRSLREKKSSTLVIFYFGFSVTEKQNVGFKTFQIRLFLIFALKTLFLMQKFTVGQLNSIFYA